jgi:uncharacterized protein YcaQ
MNPKPELTISPMTARRLAVQSQGLDRLPAVADRETMLATIRQVGCLQIDPINVVARSPLLVLWSRLGSYDEADLQHLLWEDRALFEYWAHAASIVLAEDYPLYQARMQRFEDVDVWGPRFRDWLAVNEPFRRGILEDMARRGPLYAEEIEDRAVEPWQSSGWTSQPKARNVITMLEYLWEQGSITVTRRLGDGFGLKKQWGLFEHHMPQWSDHEPWTSEQVVREAAQRSLRALGVGTEKHIRNYFIRDGYPELAAVLAGLVDDGRLLPVKIAAGDDVWPGEWFIHAGTLPLLEQLQNGAWQGRTTLLSPFDNLIADRERTEQLFDFYYRSEIYTPKAKRQYGYYVLPILHGDRLIGRIDPKMDRKTKTLHVYAVYQEAGGPEGAARDVAAAVGQLGRFLGAERVQYGEKLPAAWAKILQAETQIEA